MADLEKSFQAAQEKVKNLKKKPDNDTLLELYSYYKQAADGDLSGDRPGALDFITRAKYDAWRARKGVRKDDAMRTYIKIVEYLRSLED